MGNLSPVIDMKLIGRRLGEAEAKRRDMLRNSESQAKAEGRGLWDEQPETVSELSIGHRGQADMSSNGLYPFKCLPIRMLSLPNTRIRKLTVCLIGVRIRRV